MLKKALPFFVLFILLFGCQPDSDEEFTFPEVDFTIEPSTATVNEIVTFTAKIVAGEKIVKDADVRFEFWMDGQANADHIVIPIKHSGEGIYKLEKGFAAPGKYFMYYHADALSMHLMEKHEFTIID
ncbi:FixH family protein [Calidifontibacillus oryziterrae]|uniref:FixH family protein n=1 Tax=Calidifontibacillus oryziterrae TaxID=1191699 RepID=UPI00030F28D5|nr:FixH family protein [Calidifontibacillus oryziterrae]